MRKGKEKLDVSINAKEMKNDTLSRKGGAAGECYSQSDHVEQPVKTPASTITSTISSLKKQVELYRTSYVKARMESNNKILQECTDHLLSLAEKRGMVQAKPNEPESSDVFMTQIEKSANKVLGLDVSALEKDGTGISEEAVLPILLDNGQGGKNAVPPVKLPAVQKYPPYTTWIFLDRNQKMPEDQSVVGRRRIYYDQNGSEALIASDSEEEQIEEEEEKHEFSKGEDYILWEAIQVHGLSEAVLKALGNCIGTNSEEIEARYEELQKDGLEHKFLILENLVPQEHDKEDAKNNSQSKEFQSNDGNFEAKDLNAAMDSFDNLFCRRCLVFDCRLHGCSQTVSRSSEKQLPWANPEGASTPCGPDCHLLASSMVQPLGAKTSSLEKTKSMETGFPSMDGGGTKNSYSNCGEQFKQGSKDLAAVESSKTEPSKRGRKPKKSLKRRAEELLENIRKKQNIVAASDGEYVATGLSSPRKMLGKAKLSKKGGQHKDGLHAMLKNKHEAEEDDPNRMHNGDVKEAPKPVESMKWSELEKGLYEKGLEMFGRNSCLVSRNLLKGLKTCKEVAAYTAECDMATRAKMGDNQNYYRGNGKAFFRDETVDVDPRARTRFWRRRGRVRRLKYTWKSAGHPAIKKRILDSKDQPCRQYTPCNCQFVCGKQCTCLHNGTCCEKYCGCSKSCKNRFRGCHCAKSQCRSRQCPCFAAGRECDPDVCLNCWVGCGDGTLGGPPQRGDNYDCQNMKLLLRQQQRVLLGKSDVAGWGAFLKNSVSRHDYLGEYTGELISHKEADKRGKIYDRENSSFLFNLNDQYVLDAYRKGDKLKFANHSPHPNCYAKVIMVAGDHRVGIFAKDRILAGEELFYDYRYEPDRAPVWAKKPESSHSKKDEASVVGGRAQKVA